MSRLLASPIEAYCFHQSEVRFLGHGVSLKILGIEDKKTKSVRDWFEPISMTHSIL